MESYGADDSDVWVLKLDSDGNIPCCDLGADSHATIVDTEAVAAAPAAQVHNSQATGKTASAWPVNFQALVNTQCYDERAVYWAYAPLVRR
jgi:hypothetical protein